MYGGGLPCTMPYFMEIFWLTLPFMIWLARFFRTFGPRVAIGMHGHALDVQQPTALAEFGGAVNHIVNFWIRCYGLHKRIKGKFAAIFVARRVVEHSHPPGIFPRGGADEDAARR